MRELVTYLGEATGLRYLGLHDMPARQDRAGHYIHAGKWYRRWDGETAWGSVQRHRQVVVNRPEP